MSNMNVVDRVNFAEGRKPMNLKPGQKSGSNYKLLEALTGNTRGRLYAVMKENGFDATNYDDVAAYILLYTEKKFGAKFRKMKLSEIPN